MLSKNTRPNAAQKHWLDMIAEYAYMYGPVARESGFDGHFQLHHVVGRSYRHNKVPIGHYFVNPVDAVLHDVHSSHPENVTHFRARFTDRFGSERDLWKVMINQMVDDGCELPFGQDVIDAIMDTRY